MPVCKLFIVTGRVQGVWYRASTQQQALALGLTGYAKNLTNGDVEVMACGEPDALESLEQWLWQGPELAEVSAVSTDTIPTRELTHFESA